MVGVTGIEPVTPSMSTKCSPAELHPRTILMLPSRDKNGRLLPLLGITRYNCTMKCHIAFFQTNLCVSKNKNLLHAFNQLKNKLPYCPVLFDKLELVHGYF